MNVLLAVLTPVALINSVAILPTGSIGVAASLGAPKPTLTASAFVAGMFLPHFALGLLLALGVPTAFDQATAWIQETWRDPDVLLVLLQLVIGGAMVLFAYRLTRSSQRPSHEVSSKQLTPVGAFAVAAGVTITKFPGGLLYLAAIDQILRADPGVLGTVIALLYYNLINLLPPLLIVLAHRLLGARADTILAVVSRFLDRWGKQLMFLALLGLGMVLVVDAVGWFFGFPLLPTYLLHSLAPFGI